MTLALLYVWEDARVWAPGDHSCNAHIKCLGGFPGGSDVKKKSTSNAGDPDLIAGSGRYPGERNGNLLQYSCQENSMDRGAWRTTVHRVTKSQTRLTNTFTLHFKYLEPASCFPPSWIPTGCTVRVTARGEGLATYHLHPESPESSRMAWLKKLMTTASLV